jgi:hypothetical protein
VSGLAGESLMQRLLHALHPLLYASLLHPALLDPALLDPALLGGPSVREGER